MFVVVARLQIKVLILVHTTVYDQYMCIHYKKTQPSRPTVTVLVLLSVNHRKFDYLMFNDR